MTRPRLLSSALDLAIIPTLLSLSIALPCPFASADELAFDLKVLRDRFEDHCFGCHGDGGEEGGFSFDQLAAGDYGDQTIHKWETVWENIRAETMPPSDEQQPDAAQRAAWVDWIQADVFRLDKSRIDPGKVVLRRLNRAEYGETVRQLTDVDAKVDDLFPADDTGYGFDTIGEVLHISPVLLEKYLAAAEQIVADAIPTDGPTDGDAPKYKRGGKILYNGPPPADAEEVLLDEMTGQVIRRFATRAFRRPIDDPTVDRLCDIARQTRQIPGNRYEHGIAAAAKLVLASPRFLFRVEKPLPADQLARVPDGFPTSPLGEPIDDFSLATRLSYFLWGGPPDEALMDVAQRGELRENLGAEIDRMIKQDWRLRVGVGNFVGQWLKTRDVHAVSIDVRRVLAFRGDDSDFPWQVREAMKRETETMFRFMIEENRPAHELLNADYSFLNDRLAKFYGIDGVNGNEMQKVDLPADSHRRGILTHGSVLLVTSNPTRTSPVKRGLFILENLLGTPAPPAPPNVPSLEDSQSGEMKDASLRQVLEQHRRDPACASCHQRMDPLGLALENYNAIGQYRDMELGMPGWRGRDPEPDKPIDPKGVLMTGEKFESVVELADILANERRDDFYRCLTEKMLVFALGRGLTYSDATTVDKIVAEVKADDGKMRTLIGAIVRSVPFTHQPKPESVASRTP